MEQKQKKEFLGWANGWKETPEIVKECNAQKHKTREGGIGNCLHEVTCDICGYYYKYDSGD